MEFVYNGIDRMDNSLGYISGNVVTCCQICNRAKGAMLLEDFMLWIKQLVTYRSGVLMLSEYQECVSCLEESKGKRHTELVYIGPLKDVHYCPVCDMIGEL